MDEYYTKLPLRLQLARACAKLSGTARDVLDAIEADLWPLGERGLVSTLAPSEIGKRIRRAKSTVSEAIDALQTAGFLVKQADGSLRLVLDVPPHLVDRVEAWRQRIVPRNAPAFGIPNQTFGFPNNAPEASGFPNDSFGKPNGETIRIARADDLITRHSSSKELESLPARESTPHATNGDDDEVTPGQNTASPPDRSEALSQLKLLMPLLATAIAKQTRRNREETLETLLTVRGEPTALAQAVASLLVAIRDQGFRVRESPVGLLFHAMKRPGDYPDADPAQLAAQAVQAGRKRVQDRSRADQVAQLAQAFIARSSLDRRSLVERFESTVEKLSESSWLTASADVARPEVRTNGKAAQQAARVEAWARAEQTGQDSPPRDTLNHGARELAEKEHGRTR